MRFAFQARGSSAAPARNAALQFSAKKRKETDLVAQNANVIERDRA